jgi:EspG family
MANRSRGCQHQFMSPSEQDTVYGFEISVDEAAYLMDHIDLGGPLPDVLGLYSPVTNPELRPYWDTMQQQHLTERGIVTPNGVRPEVTGLMRDLARADETLALRIIPRKIPDTMLRVAIGHHENRFVCAARTRDLFLAQQVAAADWPEAAAKVLRAQLGLATPAPLTAPVQLSADDVKRLASRPPEGLTDTLMDLEITEHDALILNAASRPEVATELTAARRRRGTTRRTKTAVTVLDTPQGRVIAWPHTGPDQRTWITYAEGAPHRLTTAVQMLFEQLADDPL